VTNPTLLRITRPPVGRRASGFVQVAKGLSNHRAPLLQLSGGRTWWAHFEFTPIDIEPTILRKKVEDVREAGGLMSDRELERYHEACSRLCCTTMMRAEPGRLWRRSSVMAFDARLCSVIRGRYHREDFRSHRRMPASPC